MDSSNLEMNDENVQDKEEDGVPLKVDDIKDEISEPLDNDDAAIEHND